MENMRVPARIVSGRRTTDGAGVSLVRVFGYHDVKDFDPFLMLDAFDSKDPADYVKGFPWHPHRGIETITYLISGEMEHGDSLGNRGIIRDGDCQWMTAGSGIIHQEMPKPSDASRRPALAQPSAKDKMCPPKYNDLVSGNIPRITEETAEVRVLSGTYRGVEGPMKAHYVQPRYLDVSVRGGGRWTVETPPEATVFVYIVEGEGAFGPGNGTEVKEKNAVLFSRGKGFSVQAAGGGIRFLYLEGMPLGEPVAWGGPIVMNTKEELDQAFRDLDNGTFIRK
jgi:redox-sensitive bicupin YhaK (pirin superfamily)